MIPKEIFPSHIYGETYLGFDKEYLQKTLTTILLLKKGDMHGNTFSNAQFGWQSKDLPMTNVFLLIKNKINDACHNFLSHLDGFKFDEVNVENMWANINNHGDINWPHKHGGVLSGVYYVDVHDNCGDLILDDLSYNHQEGISHYLHDKHKVNLKPENDKLVIFDSNCTHLVLKNLSNKLRVSLSFNAYT